MNKKKWKTCQCLITGSKHEYRNEPNQDNVAMFSNADCVIAVLCDGVSNCINSHEASRIAVNTTLACFKKIAEEKENMKKLVDPLTTEEIQNKLKQGLVYELNNALDNHTEGDSTLVFALILKSLGYVWIGTLGDSAVCVVEKDKSYVLTQTNVYPNGATETIRNENSATLMNTYLLELENISAIFLTSDGLQGAAYLEDKNNKCYLMKPAEEMVNLVFENNCEEKLRQLLCKMRDNSKISDDDISLAIITAEPITLPEEPTWLCSCSNRNHFMDNRCSNCGKAVFELYGSAPIEDFDNSNRNLFAYYNTHPEREYAMVGLPFPVSNITENSKDIFDTKELEYNMKETEYDMKQLQDKINELKNDMENLKQSLSAKSARNISLIISLIVMIVLMTFLFLVCLNNNIMISEQSSKIDALSEQMSLASSFVATEAPTKNELSQTEATEPPEETEIPGQSEMSGEIEQYDNSNDTQLYSEENSSAEYETQSSDNWYM